MLKNEIFVLKNQASFYKIKYFRIVPKDISLEYQPRLYCLGKYDEIVFYPSKDTIPCVIIVVGNIKEIPPPLAAVEGSSKQVLCGHNTPCKEYCTTNICKRVFTFSDFLNFVKYHNISFISPNNFTE